MFLCFCPNSFLIFISFITHTLFFTFRGMLYLYMHVHVLRTFVLLLLVFTDATRSQHVDTFRNDILRYHNSLRSVHHVGPLVWDPALEESAGAWARQCVWKHSVCLALTPPSLIFVLWFIRSTVELTLGLR
jgi:hypothetical protein